MEDSRKLLNMLWTRSLLQTTIEKECLLHHTGAIKVVTVIPLLLVSLTDSSSSSSSSCNSSNRNGQFHSLLAHVTTLRGLLSWLITSASIKGPLRWCSLEKATVLPDQTRPVMLSWKTTTILAREIQVTLSRTERESSKWRILNPSVTWLPNSMWEMITLVEISRLWPRLDIHKTTALMNCREPTLLQGKPPILESIKQVTSQLLPMSPQCKRILLALN